MINDMTLSGVTRRASACIQLEVRSPGHGNDVVNPSTESNQGHFDSAETFKRLIAVGWWHVVKRRGYRR
jgi:hypothetical protein